MKITRIEARSGLALSRTPKRTPKRALKLAALGVLTMSVSGVIACGGFDNPTTSTPHVGSGGTSSVGGGSNIAGTTDTTGIAGTTVSTGGGGATGTAGDTSVAGTLSAGGSPVTTAPFCSPTATPVQARAPLPLAVTTVFVPSGYEGGDPSMSGGGQLVSSACPDRAPGAIGACSTYTYTPAAAVPVVPPALPGLSTWAGIAYILGYTGFGSQGHAPICLADGATAVTFYAKGKVGGEAVTFSAAGATAAPFVLTSSWALYTIPISGVQYNTDAMGLTDGFFFKVGPASTTDTKVVAFELDDIQYIGATGGGTGGAGGATTGGAGGAATGGGGAGGTAAGSGGTGGA